jgi:putative hemolysin
MAVNIAASSIITDLFYRNFGEKGIGASVVIMTVLLLLFGEVTPKKFAFAHPIGFSFLSSIPMIFFEKLFAPARWVLHLIASKTLEAVGIKLRIEKQGITELEIRHLVSLSKKKGVVKGKEEEMIDGVMRLKKHNAADIMTPRINVVSIDLSDSRELIMKKMKEHQYSRFPAYIHDFDNIVGIVRTKDFLLGKDIEIEEVITKPYFVPESMRLNDLLKGLQRIKTQMAVVTDEYGVTSGVVTVEDILEEIVGEIRDELDFEPQKIHKIGQKIFEVDGQLHISEINEELGLGISTDEVDTIGGYVILKMGRIPHIGECVETDGYRFTVENISKNRITNIRMERISE